MIEFSCAECGRGLRAPIHSAGKIGKCQRCGAKNPIPSAAQNSFNGVARVAKSSEETSGSRTTTTTAPLASPAKPMLETSMVDTPLGQASELGGLLPTDASDFASALNEAIQVANVQSHKIQKDKMQPDDAIKAIAGALPKQSVSMAYRMHLLLVALTMSILPLLYVALVIGVALAVGYYTFAIAPSWLMAIRVSRIAIAIYAAILTPVVAGVVLVLFMIKPLFFRIQGDTRRRSIKREAQPVLFALVDRICDALGAPRPTRIDVDYNVNAAAAPESGLLSIATGRMVLTIGVPLIAGMSSRELAGVLAHEFGHFSQKMGMGTSLIIRRVNFWFYRVVYQRDSMDVWLDDIISDSDVRIGIVFQIAQLGVWVSRGILWCFMMVGHAVSYGLMRQMEFDADRYEYGLVGSKTFEDSCIEMKRLQVAEQATLKAMLQFAQQGRLADDMIQILRHFRRHHTKDVELSIQREVSEGKAPWLSTHPSDSSRIAMAKQSSSAGIFQLDRPASELFWYFDALCKGVTWDFYRDHLGSHIMPDSLTPSSELLARIAEPSASNPSKHRTQKS